MIKSKLNNNQINTIIKDYIDNDRFSIDAEYKGIREALLHSFSNKHSLLLIISLEENKLKLINKEKILRYIGKMNCNAIILGEYWYGDLEEDFEYTQDFPPKTKEIKKFIKSDAFKNRLLEIFSEYNIKKLNGKFNSLDSLVKFNISLSEATIFQKIYYYINIYSDLKIKKIIYSSINCEIMNKSISEKKKIRKEVLKYFYFNSVPNGYNYKNFNNYYNINRNLMKFIFEKTNNEFDIILDTLINYIDLLYNEEIGDLNENFLNNKFGYSDLGFDTNNVFDSILNNDHLQNWLDSSTITNDDKIKFLKIIGTNNFYCLLTSTNMNKNILTLIKYLDNDYIYSLKFNNKVLLENSELKKFYADSLFEETKLHEYRINSSINLLQVPKYVKELYIPKDEYIKFKTYCALFNKDEKSVIPETTKIIFVEDISDKNYADKLV